jgi:2-oxoglutarate dehydrogenase E2 component (dihydrolipoamide succinyltransferase)
MTIEVRVPQLPESVADATIVSWHKKPGDAVARDENLVDLETDKVVLEVPAPAAGTLTEIKLMDGTTVTSGQLLAVIEPGATAGAVPGATVSAAPGEAPSGTAVPGASAPAIMAAPSGAVTPAATAPKSEAAKADAVAGKLSPAAKRVAEEHKVDPKALTGSGRDGRVSKSDVVNYLSAKDASPPAPKAPAGTAAPSARGARAEQRVPMTRLRARIAERMVQAQASQALLTSFNEVDLKAVNELRARYKDPFEKQHGVKLGFMSFFAKACVEALKKFPAVNASVDGNDNFAARARAGTITMEELTGGTFTITNGGVFGSLLSTPIVNSPQSAILGMHKIQDRPVAIDGQVVVRPMMYIALTYDHRIIDGREAVQFLVTVKQCLEDPARMVLGV